MTIKRIGLLSLSLVGMLTLLASLQMVDKKIEEQEELFIYKDVEIKNPIPIEMYENLEKYSEEYDIPKHIFYNIAFKETRYRGPFDWKYRPDRTSTAGALGPMQIMPSTANLICKSKVSLIKLQTNIPFNIEISAKLLRRLHNKYKDWAIVCGCYNTGKPIVNEYAKFCSSNKNYQRNWVKP